MAIKKFDHDLTHALNVVMYCHQDWRERGGQASKKRAIITVTSIVIKSAPALGECRIKHQRNDK